MKNTFLFDLDGTLLPMDFGKFMGTYFKSIGEFFEDTIDPVKLKECINEATKYTIMTNDGRTNEDKFMTYFDTLIEQDIAEIIPRFYDFYDSKFENCKTTTWEDNYLRKSIDELKLKGYTIAIATNPLLPLVSNHHRIRWAGFDPEEFTYVSSFEGNRYCKPHLQFYQEVLSKINKTPEECYMVGNDKSEDLIAAKLGISTYLVTDCVMDSHNLNIKPDLEGNSEDFYKFVCSLKTLK